MSPATAPRRLTAVVCRDHQQFRAWCLDNDRNPRDPSLRLVTREHHARGCWFTDVVLIDGPSHVMEAAKQRVRPGTGAQQET